MSTGSLQFWFDFGSTYSYPAALRIAERAARADVPVVWKPFMLGPIFKKQGWDNSPFRINPLRGAYMWHDVERVCRRHGIPFRRPGEFPRSGLLAARISCLEAAAPWCADFGRAVFRANFAEDRDIGVPETIASILAALGQDGPAIIERAQTPESKAALKRQTAEAEALGLFGAPQFVVGKEIFWGNDRLEEALEWYHRPW